MAAQEYRITWRNEVTIIADSIKTVTLDVSKKK